MDRFCFLSEGEFAGMCLAIGADVTYNPNTMRFLTTLKPRHKRPYQAIAALRSHGIIS